MKNFTTWFVAIILCVALIRTADIAASYDEAWSQCRLLHSPQVCRNLLKD